MYLIIDLGNTRGKIAVFDNGIAVFNDVFDKQDMFFYVQTVMSNYIIKAGIISSVAYLSNEDVEKLKNFTKFLVLDSNTKVPFKNNYGTPATLGVDRVAIAAGSVCKYPNKNVLVIDAGTCITFDFVNSENQYLGGAISPGINLRYKALYEFTAKLPLLTKQNDFMLIGDSTNSSIHSGVINGVVNEIDGAILKYQQKFQDLTVVLTGGDTHFLAMKLKNTIFANPNFVLDGLYSILIYNLHD